MAYVGVTNLSASQGGAADMLFAIYGAMVSASWTCMASGTGGAGGYSSSGSLITTAANFNSNGAWVRMRDPSGAGGREFILQRGSSALNAAIKYSRSDGFVSGSPGAATTSHTGTGGDGQVLLGLSTDINCTIAASGSAFLNDATGYVHCVASNTANNGVYGLWAFKSGLTNGAIGAFFCHEAVQAGSTNAADGDQSWQAVGASANNAWWSSSNPGISWWERYNLSGETRRTGGCFFAPSAVGNAGAPSTSGAGAIAFGNPASVPMGQDPYDSGKTGFVPVMISKWLGTSTAPVYPKGYTSGILIGSTNQTLLDVFGYSSAEPRVIIINSGLCIAMPWVPNVTPAL